MPSTPETLVYNCPLDGEAYGPFACLDSFTGRGRSGKEVTLTDVSVKHNCESREDRWYGDIKQYQRTSCKQTAMGWTKSCVILTLGNTWLVFGDEARRDLFFTELTSAFTDWRSRYPDLQ